METSAADSSKAELLDSGSEDSESHDEDQPKAPRKKRLVANAIEARAFDHGLHAGTGLSLERFKVRRPLEPSSNTQTRYYCDASAVPGHDAENDGPLPDGVVPKRFCIRDISDNSRKVETLGGRRQKCLLMIPDQGPRAMWVANVFLGFLWSLLGRILCRRPTPQDVGRCTPGVQTRWCLARHSGVDFGL